MKSKGHRIADCSSGARGNEAGETGRTQFRNNIGMRLSNRMPGSLTLCRWGERKLVGFW